MPLILSSTDVGNGQTIQQEYVYNGMGCSGRNLSPELEWRGAPSGTKSFAVTLFDPDASGGQGWLHWSVYNIPPEVTRLARGAGDPSGKHLPQGAAQAKTDFGKTGYGGPCPPQGDKPHRYIFTVYALDVDRLASPPQAASASAGPDLRAHVLAQSTLTGKYGR